MLCSLIFFACTFLLACEHTASNDIVIISKGNKATSIAVPRHVLSGASDQDFAGNLKVYVDTNRAMAMLGEYNVESKQVVFTPLVTLSPGMNYAVYFHDRLLGNVKVPLTATNKATTLLQVYPTTDTIPENLLKLYLQFSAPMREGQSQKHIVLVNQNKDTLRDVFLDLQPELWNKERTVLTIWLDPGRIKRDLIPNKKSGNPLKPGGRYTLVVLSDWKDINNVPLQQVYEKEFFVTGRDGLSPLIDQWNLQTPSAGTKAPLRVSFNEVLDFFLIQESIRIVDGKGNVVLGKFTLTNGESSLQFTPSEQWAVGAYTLQVDPVLEDLAGNNLSRPFDRDLQAQNPNAGRTTFERKFQVK